MEQPADGNTKSKNLKTFLLRIKTKMASFLKLGAAGVLLIYLYIDMSGNKNVTGFSFNSTLSTKSAPTVHSYVYSWPKCERNMSVANITDFNTLPAPTQEFFYYRHCRHFPMLLDIPDKCGGPEGSSQIFLLLVIKTSPGNYERREALRQTWAGERQHHGLWIRRIFLSGTTGSGKEKTKFNDLLQVEHKLYNDILQWDFADTHSNLTVKQILFLEWMERNCPNVRFLLNGDDDVFAHTDNMVDYLHSLNDNDGGKHLFVGHIMTDRGPVRDRADKYFVPVQMHESDSYPPFISGGGILLSGYTASVIYDMSKSIMLLPVDDVFLALCVERAGLRPESHIGAKAKGLPIPPKMDAYDPCLYKEILFVHQFFPKEMFLLWHRVKNPELDCSSSFRAV